MFKTFFTYLIILLCSILLSGLILEGILRHTQFLDQLDSPTPSYIPNYLYQKYKEADRDGYRDKFAFRSRYPTNNLIKTLKESSGCKVVILGDSFVWGSGLALKHSWPSKLQEISKCKIFPFGKPGWSSYQYLALYQTHLRNLKFDYLVIGIVANDPQPNGELGDLEFKTSFYQLKETKLISDKNETSFLHDFLIYNYVESVIGSYLDQGKSSIGSINNPPIISWGYRNWRNRLYLPDTFELWKDSMINVINQSNHTTCVLLTPTGNSPEEILIFDQLAEVFIGNNIPHINMMPALNDLFNNKLRPRSAWANPSDAHPGIAQNVLYAEGAADLISNCESK